MELVVSPVWGGLFQSLCGAGYIPCVGWFLSKPVWSWFVSKPVGWFVSKLVWRCLHPLCGVICFMACVDVVCILCVGCILCECGRKLYLVGVWGCCVSSGSVKKAYNLCECGDESQPVC